MLRFPSFENSDGPSGGKVSGPDVLINPEHVSAVQPFTYKWSSAPAQNLSIVTVLGGQRINVFASVDAVASALANAATR